MSYVKTSGKLEPAFGEQNGTTTDLGFTDVVLIRSFP